jgi:hypothetical protein
MPRIIRHTAAGVAVVLALTACDSSKSKGQQDSSTPTGSASSASAGIKGAGTASLTVGAKKINLAVTCTQSDKATQATGNEGTNAVTLTVKGTPVSAVLVAHGTDGSTSIFQAIAGLRDDSGKVVGKISISANGDSYSGTGTFVLTKIDRKGKRIKLTKGTSQTGKFELACTGGYAPAPVVGSSKPSSSKSS